jgi:thiamine-monophosphate kinase
VFPPETKVGDVGERELVRHLRSRIPLGSGVVVGVGDDAAALETGPLTFMTTDCLVEGIHFRGEWSPPRLLGRKALTINITDIAAMGGIPRHATVSLCLPPDLPMGFVDGVYDGLLERAAESGVNLVGGNVSAAWAETVIDITLLGSGERVLRRSGAVPGDLVIVSGYLGAAAAGLRLLGQGARLTEEGFLEKTGVWTESSAQYVEWCLRAQLDPTPPLALARAVGENDVVHAMMDLSDGLSGDLLSICEESGCAARLDLTALPVDPAAAVLERSRGGDAASLALHGGEDYQFLFAVPRERHDALKDLAVVWDIPLTVVGEFLEGEPAIFAARPGGSFGILEPQSHDHFRRKGPSAAR